MRTLSFRITLLATSIVLTLGTANYVDAALVTNVFGPYTWSTDSANFTMLAANGGVVGGVNNIYMMWDGSAFTNSSDYSGWGSASNVTLSTTAPFFGRSWDATDIQLFLPGTYSFDVTLGPDGESEMGFLNATVGPGQLGMHMLWNWNDPGTRGIDVFVAFDLNSIFGSGLLYSTQTDTMGQFTCGGYGYTGTITKNCLYDGPAYGSPGTPVKDQIWAFASVDGNGDGIMGIPMLPGDPLGGFSANFNANLTATSTVPVPAAAWLLGSGLLGLVATARRRKQT